MSETPWFPFYPSDWLAGTRGLSALEQGVYINLMAQMYEHGGPIRRDDKRLARLCGCDSRRQFVDALETLKDEGKITETDGYLANRRTLKEIEKRVSLSERNSTNAKARWRGSRAKTRENQGSVDATAADTQMRENCENPASRARPTTTTTDSPCSPPHEGDSENAGSETTNGHDPPPLLSGEPETQPPAEPDYGAEFQRWYAEYPRKAARKQAWRAYQTARKHGACAQALLDGARKYAALCRKQERPKDKIKHPSTWLNGQCWLDEELQDIALDGANGHAVSAEEDPDRKAWRRRLREYRDFRFWPPEKCGPAPGQPHCRVPSDLIAEELPEMAPG